ncbi:nucleolar protein 56 isoform X2 [Pipistrellus kuhlii]|uniref:nucleolar protein 56 isoform X2 n=1 Tax=Pipistrellus kuhlii TaxID=59472 RepID=UPI001E271E4E|nr:nucleolar protein 56 isoform X2 [Pipistrellus kuhlii]
MMRIGGPGLSARKAFSKPFLQPTRLGPGPCGRPGPVRALRKRPEKPPAGTRATPAPAGRYHTAHPSGSPERYRPRPLIGQRGPEAGLPEPGSARQSPLAALRAGPGAGAMVLLHVLFEHAVGYTLLALKEVEEISLLQPQVEECVLNLGKFHNIVRLVAFSPFASSQVALENVNAVSEGIVHEDLRLFLETYLPTKKKKVLLGVGDPKIGAAIQEELGYSCQTGGVIAEILRGMDISAIDLINIESFSSRVVSLSEYRQSLHTYLRSKMSQVAPSLSALIGEAVGARLIAHAGSLTNLAKYPASTVQILGAEKALFRALKTRGNTPKYGLIFHSTFIGRAAAKNKGRISRYLANKCSIASRIDCFSEVPTNVFGEKLREQVEERLSFYETGVIPRKNLEVMKEAMVQAEEAAAEITRKLEKQEKKRLKKEKKRLAAIALASPENSSSTQEECEELNEKPKKKKKQKFQENGTEDPPVSSPKPRKRKPLPTEELVNNEREAATNGNLPKRKKSLTQPEPVSEPEEAANRSVLKKKRKLSLKEEPLSSGPEEAVSNKSSKKKKKLKLAQEG